MALTQVPIELSSTPGIVDNSNATAITIDSSENVGIGTTSPSSYPVASELVVDTGVSGGITVVSDSTTGGYGGVYFADGTTGNEQYRGFIQYNHNNGGSVDGLLLGTSGSERLRIDSSGNVGIATSSPTDTLSVGTLGSGSNSIITIGASTTGTSSIYFGDGASAARFRGYFDYVHSSDYLAIGTAAAERMRIDSGGNVLIGRSSDPYADGNNVRLHVEGALPATDGRGQVAIATTAAYNATDRKAMLNFSGAFDTSGTPTFLAGVAGEKENTTNNNYGGALTFHTRPNGGNFAERMRIDSAGNVGIGTSSPTAKKSSTTLQVNGNVAVGDDNATGILAFGDIASADINVGIFRGAAGAYSNTDGNSLNIAAYDAVVFTTGNADISSQTERMRIKSDGDLYWHQSPSSSASGINFTNTTHPSITVSGGADTAFRHRITFVNGNGTVGIISTNGSATTYATSSDYRLKENVVELTGATDRLKQLNPTRFNFIADADTTVDGFLAHEVQAVVPEAITGTKDAVDDDGNAVYQGIDQSKLVPLLVATIQELEARITQLENN